VDDVHGARLPDRNHVSLDDVARVQEVVALGIDDHIDHLIENQVGIEPSDNDCKQVDTHYW